MFEKSSLKPVFVFAFVASTTLGSAALASSHKGHVSSGDMGHMMKMMQHMHDRMHSHGKHGHNKSDMGMMRGGMKKMLDANGDGHLTHQEAAEQLQTKLKEFDADGNGSLSIAEYEALHSAMIREQMVDRFQHLDADGDGQVTSEEMNAPAAKMKRMQQKRAMMKSGGMSKNSDGMSMSDDGTESGQFQEDTEQN